MNMLVNKGETRPNYYKFDVNVYHKASNNDSAVLFKKAEIENLEGCNILLSFNLKYKSKYNEGGNPLNVSVFQPSIRKTWTRISALTNITDNADDEGYYYADCILENYKINNLTFVDSSEWLGYSFLYFQNHYSETFITGELIIEIVE